MDCDPQPRVRERNSVPAIVRIHLVSPACSTTSDASNCVQDSPLFGFAIRFDRRPFRIKGHYAEIGLRGGELAAKLIGTEVIAFSGEEIKTWTFPGRAALPSANATTMHLNPLNPGITIPVSGNGKGTALAVCHIYGSNFHGHVHWRFELTSEKELLQGTPETIEFLAAPLGDYSCGLEYEFKTARGDWDYYLAPSKHVSLLKRWFVRALLWRRCRINVDTLYCERPSDGELQCMKKKA